MLTLQECIDFGTLTPEQVEAIADHQGLEMIVATDWAERVLDRPDGGEVIRKILADRVAAARAQGDRVRSRRYQACLDEFVESHLHWPALRRSG